MSPRSDHPQAKSVDLATCSIAELQAAFAQGACTALAVCQACLERIAAIDVAGPMLRAVIEINPDAEAIAGALDQERRERGPRGPLHGVPVLVKDSLDTADRMLTTAGSLAMVGNIAPQDAAVVASLRRAGAVLLGKTNMSEWCYIRSTRACSGWSSRGGQVRNPYVLDRSPLGSSSGSAVAVAAGLCVAAIGAEVDGSIVRPVSSNAVVGLKPTVGLISRAGVIGVAAPQDTAGPMARSVADLAVLLNALAGRDPDDPATDPADEHRPPDYGAFLDPAALQGARLGVARECFGQHEGTDAVIEQGIAQLRDLGAETVDPVRASALPFFGDLELELFRFNRDHAAEVMPYFQQEFLEQAQTKSDPGDPACRQVMAELRRLSRSGGIDRALREHRLDALIAPTEGSPPFVIDPLVGDHILPGGCSTPPAVAGYPHISVPAGQVQGLPVGLSFFAGPWQEGKLLGYAFAFEQATRHRRTPRFLPTLPAAWSQRGSL